MTRQLSKRNLAQKMKLHFARIARMKSLNKMLQLETGRIYFGTYGSALEFVGHVQPGFRLHKPSTISRLL